MSEDHIASALNSLYIGKLRNAFESATAAVEADPRCAMAHNCLGLCLIAAKLFAEAAIELELATEIEPHKPHYWSSLARAYRHLERLPEAKSACERSLELERTAGQLISYGGLLLDMDEVKRAKVILREALGMELSEAEGLLVDGYLNRAEQGLASDQVE